MEKYSSYKDSGEKWLGEIPGHWDLIKTSYVFDKIGSGTTPASGNADYYSEDGEYFLQTGDLNDGVIKSTSKKITQKAIRDKSMKIYPKDSLVIAMYGATIGKMGILGINTTVNQACCVMSPSSKISIKYAFYMFTVAKTNLLLQSKGGGQPNISQETICNERIIVPPLPEQQAIVSYLDRVTGDIDRAIAESQRMIDLLNERKQIIIQHAVTKGLNPNAKRKYSGVEWIGDVPEGWECLPLKRCVTFVNTKAQNHNQPRISLENIESWTGKYIKTDSVYEGTGIQFVNGDILFGKLRPYLAKVYLAQMEGEALGDFWVLRANDFVTPQYLQTILLSYQFVFLVDSSTYGAKMPRADWKTNSKILIPIPSIEEQQEIVEHISKECEHISQAIASAERKISLLRERKQIIINEVVTGKVKVR